MFPFIRVLTKKTNLKRGHAIYIMIKIHTLKNGSLETNKHTPTLEPFGIDSLAEHHRPEDLIPQPWAV